MPILQLIFVDIILIIISKLKFLKGIKFDITW
jgi:hypothetical protein